MSMFLVVALLAVAVAAAAALLRRPAPPPVLGHSTQITSEPGLELFPAISPDGKVVAYAAGSSARMRIYLRPVRGGRTLPISTDTATVEWQPRWSPDGEADSLPLARRRVGRVIVRWLGPGSCASVPAG